MRKTSKSYRDTFRERDRGSVNYYRDVFTERGGDWELNITDIFSQRDRERGR